MGLKLQVNRLSHLTPKPNTRCFTFWKDMVFTSIEATSKTAKTSPQNLLRKLEAIVDI